VYWFQQSKSTGGWNMEDLPHRITVLGLLVVFVIVRAHLSSIPALVVRADWMHSKWETFKATPAHPDALARAMLILGFSYSVVPLAIICTGETMLFLIVTGGGLSSSSIMQAPVILLFLVAYGFCLVALAYLGGLLFRTVGGILGFAFAPAILGILLGLNQLRDLFPSPATDISVVGPYSPTVAFLAFPEQWIRLTLVSGGTHDLTGNVIATAILACALWTGLWLFVRWTLRVS
jgi:hypothetical protein